MLVLHDLNLKKDTKNINYRWTYKRELLYKKEALSNEGFKNEGSDENYSKNIL